MTRAELLQELRDIGPPVEPPWWLLAPGHLLLILLAFASVGLAWYWLKRKKNKRLLLIARAELDRIGNNYQANGDVRQLSLALSRWLKQVALLAYPERRPEGLTGSDWLAFLDEALDEKHFSEGDGQVFGNAIYRRQVDFDGRNALDLCETWLNAVKPRLLQRGER